MGKHNKILDSWKHDALIRGVHIPVYGVTKSSKYGVFTNTVIPCSQDYKNINDWDGYKFAERKCDINIIHAKAKILKERAKGILNVYKTLKTKYETSKNYEGLVVIEDLYYQYELAQKEYEQAYAQYKYMKEDFSDYTTRMIEHRKKFNDKIQEQRKMNMEQ